MLFIIFEVIGCVPAFDAIMLSASKVNTILAVVLFAVAIFLARLCFYGMQFGIGL